MFFCKGSNGNSFELWREGFQFNCTCSAVLWRQIPELVGVWWRGTAQGLCSSELQCCRENHMQSVWSQGRVCQGSLARPEPCRNSEAWLLLAGDGGGIERDSWMGIRLALEWGCPAQENGSQGTKAGCWCEPELGLCRRWTGTWNKHRQY